MLDAKFGGALWFVLGELAEIIKKAGGRTAVEARPERGFADGRAAGKCHALVIVRRAADHVGVRFYVAHGELIFIANGVELLNRRNKLCDPLFWFYQFDNLIPDFI